MADFDSLVARMAPNDRLRFVVLVLAMIVVERDATAGRRSVPTAPAIPGRPHVRPLPVRAPRSC